jgi:hypothetical protein
MTSKLFRTPWARGIGKVHVVVSVPLLEDKSEGLVIEKVRDVLIFGGGRDELEVKLVSPLVLVGFRSTGSLLIFDGSQFESQEGEAGVVVGQGGMEDLVTVVEVTTSMVLVEDVG